jgi:uncharacterized protein YjiS (DUF1127 family)
MTTITDSEARSHSSPWTLVGVAIGHIVRTVLVWCDRARERRQLLSLSDSALKDIGRGRADLASSMPRAVWVIGEGDQPYWRARITCPDCSRSHGGSAC